MPTSNAFLFAMTVSWKSIEQKAPGSPRPFGPRDDVIARRRSRRGNPVDLRQFISNQQRVPLSLTCTAPTQATPSGRRHGLKHQCRAALLADGVGIEMSVLHELARAVEVGKAP